MEIEEISLARWIASFYICAEGEALGAMLPSGKKESEIASLTFDDTDFSPSRVELSEEQKDAIKGILDEKENKSAYIFGVNGIRED